MLILSDSFDLHIHKNAPEKQRTHSSDLLHYLLERVRPLRFYDLYALQLLHLQQ